MNLAEHYEQNILQFADTQVPALAFKVFAALLTWLIGRWMIGKAVHLVKSIDQGNKIDTTLAKYLQSIMSVTLHVLLIVAILDIFGVSTTSLAALLAGAGLAIGTACGGILTHFAAGAFLQVFRPYKVGDVVSIGSLTGTVTELGLFGTTVLTDQNVVAVMGNNNVFSGIICNYSARPTRRVDCTVNVAFSADVFDELERLRSAVMRISNVAETPAPEIEILQFSTDGLVVCVRPYTHISHYNQVFFDTQKTLANIFAQASDPAIPVATTVSLAVKA
jgi:small conductance mechanosensitive channel